MDMEPDAKFHPKKLAIQLRLRCEVARVIFPFADKGIAGADAVDAWSIYPPAVKSPGYQRCGQCYVRLMAPPS